MSGTELSRTELSGLNRPGLSRTRIIFTFKRKRNVSKFLLISLQKGRHLMHDVLNLSWWNFSLNFPMDLAHVNLHKNLKELGVFKMTSIILYGVKYKMRDLNDSGEYCLIFDCFSNHYFCWYKSKKMTLLQ